MWAVLPCLAARAKTQSYAHARGFAFAFKLDASFWENGKARTAGAALVAEKMSARLTLQEILRHRESRTYFDAFECYLR